MACDLLFGIIIGFGLGHCSFCLVLDFLKVKQILLGTHSIIIQSISDYPQNRYYEMENEVLMKMYHPDKLTFCGKTSMQVIYGTVNVMGYNATHFSGLRLPIFSPDSNSFLTISTQVYLRELRMTPG